MMPNYLIQPQADYTVDRDDLTNAVFGMGVTDPGTVSGLTNGTAYVAREFVLSPESAAFTPVASDAIAPSLSNLLASKVGSTGWTAVVDTNEANGSLFYVVSQNATENEATVLAGTSQPVTQTGEQTVSGSGLSPSTTYRLHILHRDAAGNSSPVLSSDEFTTDAASGLPDQSFPDVQVFHGGFADTTWADPTINNVVDFGGATVDPSSITLQSNTEYRNGTFSTQFNRNNSGEVFEHVVFRNIVFERGFRIFDRGVDMLFEECVVTDPDAGEGSVIQFVPGGIRPTRWRFRNNKFLDIRRASRAGGWGSDPFPVRTSGVFLSGIYGLDIVENLFDYIGWGIGYDENLGPGPQPPSQYSHCCYIQKDCDDVAVQRNIFSRGASFGVQVRPGGTIRDNIAVDCNNSINAKMGNTDQDPPGPTATQTHMTRNLFVDGSNKHANWAIGAKGGGVWLEATGLVYTDNVRINCVDTRQLQTPLIFEADTVLATDLSSILSPANLRADHRAAWAAARAAVGL
jgi:hypothetical protein